MGRLAHQKGFDVLLRAFAACAARHRAWSLVILGEGDQRRMLEAQRAELGLSDRVKFPGWVPEPIRLLRQADLFVMSSRYEGLPLALLEAMACGLPAISTDCPTGPSEVIRHGENGWLVPVEDVDALAAALDRLMGDGEMRRRLALRATDVTKQFGAQRIMTLWMDLIERLTRRAGRPGTPPSVPQRPAAS
jgi:glycosyltransferase involved in cell wall biosynthesis